MKKMNARLEWKGRKLLCNGRCVADAGKYRDDATWYASGNDFYVSRKTEAGARRYINRRFGLKVS